MSSDRALIVSVTIRGEEAHRVREYCLTSGVPMTLLIRQCAFMGLVEKGVISKEKIIQPTKAKPRMSEKAEKVAKVQKLLAHNRRIRKAASS